MKEEGEGAAPKTTSVVDEDRARNQIKQSDTSQGLTKISKTEDAGGVSVISSRLTKKYNDQSGPVLPKSPVADTGGTSHRRKRIYKNIHHTSQKRKKKGGRS